MSRRTHWIKVKYNVEGLNSGVHTVRQCKKFFLAKENREILDEIRQLALSEDEGFTQIFDIRVTGIKLVSNCYGCRTDQPNQQAHMDEGGCLAGDRE